MQVGQEIEVRPGIVSKTSDGKIQCKPILSRIVSLFAEQNELQYAVPGGLIGALCSYMCVFGSCIILYIQYIYMYVHVQYLLCYCEYTYIHKKSAHGKSKKKFFFDIEQKLFKEIMFGHQTVLIGFCQMTGCYCEHL